LLDVCPALASLILDINQLDMNQPDADRPGSAEPNNLVGLANAVRHDGKSRIGA
jgi:hypothetical protein